MGRPRKPIEQHRRDGTYQPCRHKGVEPKSVKPEMPGDLKGEAAQLWSDLTPILEDMGIYTAADSLALRLLCDSYAFYMEASEYVKEHGSYYVAHVTRGGLEVFKEHPASKAVSRHRKEIIEMCRQLGLTPASRTGLNVSKTKSEIPSELSNILRGGRN